MRFFKKSILAFALLAVSLVACSGGNSNANVGSISFNENSVSLLAGNDAYSLTPTVVAKDTTKDFEKGLLYSLSKSGVVALSASEGKHEEVLSITPLSVGDVVLTATSKGDKSVTGVCNISVTKERQEHDYTTDGSCRLNRDYVGQDFYTTGIGEMKLHMSIDGDTTHFKPVVTTTSDEVIKSRYLAVDTPESTGRIQMWGKTASNFTKDKVKTAAEHGTIVVTSPLTNDGRPSVDSNLRYLSLVWVSLDKKNCPFYELVCLNLWIIQEGLATLGALTDVPEYRDSFVAANEQAKALKKNMHSGETEPGWNTKDYAPMSLLDIKLEMEKSIKDVNYTSELDGEKVRVTGTVAGFSNGTLYLVDYYDEEQGGRNGGEWAGINVFCGMSVPHTRYTTPNTYMSLCAYIQDTENFGFQLTGAEGHFPSIPSLRTDNDAEIIRTPEENALTDTNLYTYEFSSKSDLAVDNQYSNLKYVNVPVSVTEPVEVSSFYINPKGDEITLRFKDCDFSVYITNFSWCKFDPNFPKKIFKEEEDYLGKKFLVSGVYSWHRGATGSRKLSFQIIPISKDSISLFVE